LSPDKEKADLGLCQIRRGFLVLRCGETAEYAVVVLLSVLFLNEQTFGGLAIYSGSHRL